MSRSDTLIAKCEAAAASLAAARTAAEQARDKRDRAVRAAVAAGVSRARVGRAVGLHYQNVSRIVSAGATDEA